MLALYIAALAALLAPARDLKLFADTVGKVAAEERPLFLEDDDRKKTAALLTAVAFRESSFRLTARSATGDSCWFQVHGHPELEEDAEACTRVAIGLLRQSMLECPAHPLAFYASGPAGCTNARAQRISKDRMTLASWLARTVKP